MLYEKSKARVLDDALFQAPTAEYRGAPFWSWNCKLEEKELLRQIEELKEMGFGGFHMHCRAGMSTEYLSDDFMKLIKACVKKAKKEDMLAWLYDEDRWPSGFAGGIVTQDVRYRKRLLVFSPEPPDADTLLALRGHDIVKGAHIDYGRFDIILNDQGELVRYRRLKEGEEAEGEVYYAYVAINEPTPRFNNQTYVDTLNPEAIKRFIEVTYEAYKKSVGKEFDRTVPAIFTDEPQFTTKLRLSYAKSKEHIKLPWTDDLEESFVAAYGESLIDSIPELIWNLPGGEVSVARYRYHAHVCQRFTNAFADQCGAWCKNNGLALTGHMMEEPTLKSQTGMLGEAMPSYRGFQIPGIDMLRARFEFNTAKQCQSAVRQYGREAMMSELYGVTSWDFDFRDYKIAGDWQAAMGVTVRVPHLSWVSMEGEAKRDYPATFGYQSPWYKKFRYVEDHFARLNTALTRGKPVVRIGVIHPIESYWLNFGPEEQSALICSELESNFSNISRWLLFGGYDFDYICETTLPELCPKGCAPLTVGKMSYDAVIVPACQTLRSSTVERLEAFRLAGGTLIFMGDTPTLMDAIPSDAPKKLYEISERIPFSRAAVLAALEELREIELRRDEGVYTDDILYQMRQDGDDRWVFLCKAKFPGNKDLSRSYTLRVKVKGEWSVTLYNTQNGEITEQPADVRGGWTYISKRMYEYDSFLFRLSPMKEKESSAETVTASGKGSNKLVIATKNLVPYTRGESNALLLDMAEYALDGEEYRDREELLRIDTECRRRLDWAVLSGGAAQPWCIENEPIVHHLKLRFRVNSEMRIYGARLAMENPDRAEIVWNGVALSNQAKDYYVDRSIRTVRIPIIKKGENILELTLPFGKRTATEWCYILGSFGTRVVGSETVITTLPDVLGYGNIVHQGLSFYSGTLDYLLDVDVPADGELRLRVPQYRGTLIEVLLDGETVGEIVYPPYDLSIGKIRAGAHRVTLRLYVPRTNGFGPVHLADEKCVHISPGAWRTKGDSFGYEYHLQTEGILTKPMLELLLDE
ncbi:MAG: hypothetical protein IJW44_00675 [Clostridia bacterium]|nr:hypothetical protein [Clostridia bacterium]